MIFNVKDAPYNAQGDGEDDDLNAIQEAIDDAFAVGGGIVLLPPGAYKINSVWIENDPPDPPSPGPRTILMRTGVVLQGSGTSNTRIFQEQEWDDPESDYYPPTNGFWSIVAIPYNSTDGPQTDIVIRDISLDGGYTSTTNPGNDFQRYHGIDIRSARRVTVQNVRVLNCAGDGIRINAGGTPGDPPSTEILVENCSFDTIWRIGVSLGRDYRNVCIRSCTFRNWDDFAIKAEVESATSDEYQFSLPLTVRWC